MFFLNYLFGVVLPFLTGISTYSHFSDKKLKSSMKLAPYLLLLPNLLCYAVTIYPFGLVMFNFDVHDNVFILKYGVLNFVLTNLLVIIIVFIEKRFTVSIGVEYEKDKSN